MQNRCSADAAPSAVEKKLFDGGFLDSVFAERMARHVFSRGHRRWSSMHPHRTAMEEERLARLQRVQEVLGASRRKADEIDYRIRREPRDAGAKCPCSVLGSPVDVEALHCVPGGMRHIRLALSTAGDDHLMPSPHEPGNEER